MALCFGGETEAYGTRQSWVPWLRSMPRPVSPSLVWLVLGRMCWDLGGGTRRERPSPCLVLPNAPSLAAAGFSVLAAWHGGGGSSALMLLLGYLGTSDSVSCLVEGMFSYQVLL